jgi:type VI secretion system protein ImpG
VQQTGASAAIRLRLEITAGLKFSQLEADKLVIHLRPLENLAGILYEQLLAHSVAVVVQTAGRPPKTCSVLAPAPVRAVGFEEEEALLPPGARSYSGYRVLQEYFAFTSRFLFLEVSGLRAAFAGSQENMLDLIFCLKDQEPRLERRVQGCFALHCVPAVNLFPMDNIIVDLKDEREEHLVVPDRVRTLEYEVYSVQRVVGRPRGSNKPDDRYEFHPFYFSPDKEVQAAGFFSTRRTRRNLTDQEIRHSPVSDYLGSEVYLSLAGPALRDTLGKISALHVSALCTNRHVTARRAELQFDLGIGAPVTSIKTLAKSAPRPSHLEGRMVWRVISHLALNYRSLLSGDDELGAEAVQELLRLYVAEEFDLKNAQVRALKGALAEGIFRRVGSLGPITYARGLKVRLEFDETPFSESGVFLFGSVLDRFLSRYVTMNSFVQTELATKQRGRIYTWPIAKGMRQML